jgi:segregation and condensation protein B
MSGESTRFEQLRLLEAALFAAEAPRTAAQLARHLPDGAEVPGLLDDLAAQYAGRGVQLRRIGDAWAFRTAPDLAGQLQIEQVQTRKLSRAAVETLAIIAYHQPVTRGEIEEIRGVGLSKGTLDTLLEAGWVRPKGRRQSPGRPLTWATTPAFLDHFGLSDIGDLPGMEELKAAGLLDTRPALNALAARGELDGGGEGEGDDGEAGDDAPTDPEVLAADFGEDLLPEDDADGDAAPT